MRSPFIASERLATNGREMPFLGDRLRGDRVVREARVDRVGDRRRHAGVLGTHLDVGDASSASEHLLEVVEAAAPRPGRGGRLAFDVAGHEEGHRRAARTRPRIVTLVADLPVVVFQEQALAHEGGVALGEEGSQLLARHPERDAHLEVRVGGHSHPHGEASLPAALTEVEPHRGRRHHAGQVLDALGVAGGKPCIPSAPRLSSGWTKSRASLDVPRTTLLIV